METIQAPVSEDELEDQKWIRAFQSGQEEGFNRLVLKHQDKIFGLCMRLLSHPFESPNKTRLEAEDIAQEAMVRAYHGLADFRMDSKFSSWLYRIAVNACKNRLASKTFREEKFQDSLDAADGDSAPRSQAPDQVLESKNKNQAIEAAISRLPEEQKILVVLRDVEGRSYEEVAEMTGLNLGTVKSRLNRGRSQLQEWLKEYR